jgi:MscS family membrane protein
MTFSEILNQLSNNYILDNSLTSIAIFCSIIISGFILKQLVSKLLGRAAFRFIKKFSYNVSVDSFIELIKQPFESLFIIWFLYFAFSFLSFPGVWNLKEAEHFGLKMIIEKGYQIAFFISATWLVLRLIDFFALAISKREEDLESKLHEQLIPFLKEFIKIIVLIFSCFLFLGIVFDMNVASIITGLGIGGLAVALSAKESLENLLASFTIFLDKPFVVGDTVKIGNVIGTVERVGFRSTRIRTLEKSLVSMPNKKMVDEVLDNLTNRNMRRVKFNIGLKLDNKKNNIDHFVTEIKKIVHDHLLTGPDYYIYFQGFDEVNYSIYVLYFINTAEEKNYIKIREEINLGILELAEKNEIIFEVYVK